MSGIKVNVSGECDDSFAERLADMISQTVEADRKRMMAAGPPSPKGGPKKETHPSIGKCCPVCSVPFKVGDYTTILVQGTEGCNAYGQEIHWECGN